MTELSPKRRKRSSSIWEYFSQNENQSICNECGKTFQASSSTSSLRYHFTKHHGASVSGPLSTFETSKSHALLAKFIAKTCVSPHVIDDPSFQNFVLYLQPKWTTCNSDKLKLSLIPALKKQIETTMKEHLKKTKYVSLALDRWIGLAEDSYLSIAVHGVSKAFHLESFTLEVRPFPLEEQNPHAVANLVEDTLGRWGISMMNVVAGTSDDVCGFQPAVRDALGLTWVQCAARAIQHSVQVGLEDAIVAPVLQHGKEICKFFRSTAKAAKMLQAQQKLLGVEVKRLKVMKGDRSGSAYRMMKRLLANRETITVSLLQLASAKDIGAPPPHDLNADEWLILEHTLQVLGPLHEAMEFISTERQPTIAFVSPIVDRLLTYHLVSNDMDPAFPRALKELVGSALSKQWMLRVDTLPDVFLLAIYLDIRLKDFAFVNGEAAQKALIKRADSVLTQLYTQCVEASGGSREDMDISGSVGSVNNVASVVSVTPDKTTSEQIDIDGTGPAPIASPPAPVSTDPSTSSSSSSSCSTASPSQVEKLSGLYGDLAKASAGPDDMEVVTNEMESYRKKKAAAFAVVGKITDPFLWWRMRRTKFPILAKLARRYLCVLATSVPSEHIIPKNGWILGKRRGVGSTGITCETVFISSNFSFASFGK